MPPQSWRREITPQLRCWAAPGVSLGLFLHAYYNGTAIARFFLAVER
jgi:hypothetical protein